MINLLQSSKKKYKLFLNYELHEWCKCDLEKRKSDEFWPFFMLCFWSYKCCMVVKLTNRCLLFA